MAGRLIARLPHVGEKFPKRGVWRRLIRCWVRVLNLYLENEKNVDIPHWHIERSHTGFFAAAAWNMGGVALEEYAVRRGRRSGRCDLYFCVDGVECSVEAKHDGYLSYSENSFDKNVKRVKTKMLKDATKQLNNLSKLPGEGAKTGVALCWIVPRLQQGRENEKEVLKKITREFEDTDHIVAAYFVPVPERRSAEKREKENGKLYTYPGVIMVGRLVWKKRRVS